eukprot:TRINITY_DN2637_c0_g1_i6.p1 TRINITY_DN2637_c0_g1~~TRINITY_DN2637_c0_g1_i6.p1  ORF type:complete len:387 (+),score=64.75 TRINITY_DN2637_c0_g1_i6:257-1417(+)
MEAAATVGWVLGAAEDTVAATAGVAGASQLAAEAVSASASVASAVVVAAPAAGRVAGSAPLLGAAGVVAPIAGAAAPQTPLFGPHFVLRSASHLIYMGVLVAILLQVVTHLSLLHTASPPSTAQAYRLARLLILHAAMYVATGILAFYFTPFALGHVPLVLRAALSVALYAVGAHPPMTPIAYAAAHTFLRVPVDWLGTALAPHVGEVEDALATALTAYATARQSAKAAALAALAALADLDEDSGGGDVADAGGGGRPDGAAAGLDDGTAASTDGVTRGGCSRRSRLATMWKRRQSGPPKRPSRRRGEPNPPLPVEVAPPNQMGGPTPTWTTCTVRWANRPPLGCGGGVCDGPRPRRLVGRRCQDYCRGGWAMAASGRGPAGSAAP